MKELTIRFDGFTLFINVVQQVVVYINWLGQSETYSMDQFFKLLERARGAKP